MPLNPYNPVMQGMVNAYGLADRLRSYALQKQRLDFEEEREQRMAEEAERLAQQRERQFTLQDIQARMSLATNPNLAEVGAEDIRTVNATVSPDFSEPRTVIDKMGLPVRQMPYVPGGAVGIGVPAESAVEYGGKRYAVRSPEEMENRAFGVEQRKAEAQLAAKIRETQAVRQATALPLPAEIAARVGLPAGTLVSSADLVRLAAGGEEAPVNWQSQMTDQGLVQVSPRSGEVRQPTLAGTKLTRTPRTSTGELTANQRATQERLKENRKRDNLANLEREEAALQPQVVQLRQAATGFDAEGNKLKPGQVALAKSQLTVKENRLKQIRKDKVELGFTTLEEAGLVKRGSADEVAAAPKTWEDYKRSKTGGQ